MGAADTVGRGGPKGECVHGGSDLDVEEISNPNMYTKILLGDSIAKPAISHATNK